MTNTTADLVEEALGLIGRGELSLDAGPLRYGDQWAAIQPAVETALKINQASQPPLVSARPFVALDKKAGWAALQTQLAAVQPAVVAATPTVKARPPRSGFSWNAWAVRFLPRMQKVGLMAVMTLVLFVGLAVAINDSEPGGWLYRAKLGWDHVGELTSFSANDRAQASLAYADRRLEELENLAVNGRPEQQTEAQGQYLRGLELSLYYADNDKFNRYAAVYSRLSDQRDRVYRLQSYTFMSGQRPIQVASMLDHLNAGVYILAAKVPGAPPETVPPANP